MEKVLQQKRNDCCICAYAMAEGVSWKIAKRRLRKHLASKKTLGVKTLSIRIKGLRGYTLISEGSFISLNEAFQFKTGILLINYDGINGHAVYWNGTRLVDHVANSRYNTKDFSPSPYNGTICGILVKNECTWYKSLYYRLNHWKKLIWD